MIRGPLGACTRATGNDAHSAVGSSVKVWREKKRRAMAVLPLLLAPTISKLSGRMRRSDRRIRSSRSCASCARP